MHKDSIAIIGIGCRFPGGIHDIETFWKVLTEGRDVVSEVPADRWNVERFYDPEHGIVGKSIAKRGGFLEDIEHFDPQFFGISPREAPYIDPQQRLLLETAWEALEDAGEVLDLDNGTDIGVFMGVSHTDYQHVQGGAIDRQGISAHSPTGNAHSIAANRISYCFNLKGPSMSMDTACSSALTAVHIAVEQIRAGRCKMAMAGGVTVMITPDGFIGFSQAGMLSPEGRCAAFDASASGFVRGEGAGVVLLKPLAQAIADGNPVYGVIVGTSLNQDGHTNGISLPSPEAQAQLVKDACADAGIDPSEVGFVEAHGTGTAVGDPIEATALSEALCAHRSPDNPLPIGSVKTNLGHLETAAGVVGLVKALLVLKHGQIPPSLHFTKPNEHIDLKALKLRVPTTLEPFPKTKGPRMVGVNSFGFGGANAHVIVAEAPAMPSKSHRDPAVERGWPIVLSARSEAALQGVAAKLGRWIEEHEQSNGTEPMLPALTYTLGARRNHHQHRLTLVARTASELATELKAFSIDPTDSQFQASFTPRRESAPRIGFVMSGQGPQWWGMGRELMKCEPVFRKTMEACAAAMKPHARFSLLEELARDEADSRMQQTEVAQPAIFAMQVSLAELWKSMGVQPAAIVGHSVGEIAAACVAGILSLEEGARIIVLRARLMHECARGDGTMLAVGLPEEEALALIARHDRTVSIAAFNGPKSLTLSGPRVSLEAMQAELEAGGVFARFVRVDHPFHHAMMQPAADALAKALADLKPQDETVPFFSTVTGARCAGKDCTGGHWGRGIRQAVQFVPAVNAVADFGVDMWLEISSHPALAVSIQECLAARGEKAPVTASTRREREHDSLLESVLSLHRSGAILDFAAMTPSREFLALPAYAWDKSRWWHEAADLREGRLAPGGRGLLDMRVPRATPIWSVRFDNRHMAYLKDHKVDTHVIFPAAGFVEIVLEAGQQIFEGRPFVVEDFEIRKPLILPDPVSGLLVEITYEPSERTFTIQSKFEQAATWSVHVVGSLRGERTESSFAATTFDGAGDDLEPEGVGQFYGHMSDLGLRYGEEFRPIRELAAGGGRSVGRVSLSEAIAKRAAEYAFHPVLMDGSLQVFSAGAKTVEDRRSKMKLPVRFAKILFLRSPGATCQVSARVLHFNEELIEGRIGVYDDQGRPCVLVDGFRAISMSAARRPGASGGSRDLLYHVDWERSASTLSTTKPASIPLAELRDAAGKTLEEIIAVRGRTKLQTVMADEDHLAAALLARGLRAMGADPKSSFTADSLGVAQPMRKVFARLMDKLAQRGLLKLGKKGACKPTAAFVKAADKAESALRDFILKHPGHLPEAMLCASTTAELGPILRGEKDAVQILFSGTGAELLDQFYGDGLFSSHWMACITRALREAAASLPEGRGLRILEIGAGTAGLAAQLLPLLERGVHSYTFTDVSAGFFPAANQKLAAFPEVECKVFDLEKPAADQGFKADTYDFIIGTNVLHAVADVRATLRSLEGILKPGGTLLFMDVATPQLWTESVFGLTSGWWHLTDTDLRPEQPLLKREQWEAVLREAGFAETASLPGLTGPDGGEGQIAVLARKAGVAPQPAIPELETAVEASWLIFADASDLGDRIAAKTAASGARCRVVRRGKKFAKTGDAYTIRGDEPAHWQQLFTELTADSPPEHIVYLWSLDAKTDSTGKDALMGIDSLLHLTHALEETLPVAKLRFDLVTRGAQPAGRDLAPTQVAQAPSIGIFRVILSEHTSYSCRSIDLPAAAAASDADLLWHELLGAHTEREVALRGEARYSQRLTRGLPTREQPLSPDIPLRLESRERGLLDSLRFTPFLMPECEPDQVLIKVKAAGMNFRDVLKALGLYPAETIDARIFGDEVAGEVVAVGSDVTHLAVGDKVFGLAVFGLATHTLARATDIRKMPSNLTYEEAATLPVVFMTAWYALHTVARMKKGETILVHAGAGGVGMAAIQIAHHLGADVIASAGSPAKRALLKTLGVKHVIDSRRGDFAESVMELTNGRGVDVVLNALASEAIPMGLSCLAESGRFVEIGKRDIYQNSRLPLWSLRRNASFHVVAMDAVSAGDAEQTRELMARIAGLVEKGALTALPYRSFPASRIDAAFRLMAGGKHTGKVIVAFSDSFVLHKGEPPLPPFEIKPDAAYLITGGLGGFGRVLSEWLIECGARHLVLSSRSGASTPEAQAFVAKLEAQGVRVTVAKADIGSAKEVRALIAQVTSSATPLKGVFHLAMVIDDAPLSALTRERLESVLAPKALGAWLLHENTRDLDLDCFVMFSSVSSIFGNPAQGNYSAANTFLDSLAHYRRAQGLAALTINWGVLGGEGYVARNERVAEFLARQGTAALSPGEVTTLMESFLTAHATQVAAIRVDWAKWRQSFRSMQENPLLERIFAAGFETQESGGGGGDWKGKIQAAAPDERDAVIGQAVRDVVGTVLRVKPDTLRDDQPLTDLGLDSLMGVEIENLIESSIGVALPPTSLMRARTIGQIAGLISEHLGGGPATATAPKVEEVAETVAAQEVDLDSLSDEDIDSLLGGSSEDAARPQTVATPA